MSHELSQFRDNLYDCLWIFDLFGYGFDHLSEFLAPPDPDNLQPEWELEQDRVADLGLAERIVQSDGNIPDEVWAYLDLPGDDELLTQQPFLLRLFCTLQAIDESSTSLNYYNQTRFPFNSWSRTLFQLFQRGGELKREVPGNILLKPKSLFPDTEDSWWTRAISTGEWENIPERGKHYHRCFDNLCRVPEIKDCHIEHRILHQRIDLEKTDWSTLRVGVIPLIDKLRIVGSQAYLEPGPVRLTRGHDPKTFEISLDSASDINELCNRAERAIRFLQAKQVQIILFPEVVVPDAVLDRIKAVLRATPRGDGRFPQILLAGTFVRPAPGSTGPPFNVAVVLNSRGDELLRQSKLHPYEMKDFEQTRYGLDGVLSSPSAREHIQTFPRRLVFCDSKSTGIRMAVMICEDAAHESPSLHAIRALRPNLVMNPVMAGALLSDRSFAGMASRLAQDPGTMVLVANSAALARAEWKHPASGPPLAIVALPLAHNSDHRPIRLLQDLIEVDPGLEVLLFQCPT